MDADAYIDDKYRQTEVMSVLNAVKFTKFALCYSGDFYFCKGIICIALRITADRDREIVFNGW